MYFKYKNTIVLIKALTPSFNISVRALATFLVDQKNYPKSLMDPFNTHEIKIMSKANVIDWQNFTVSRVDKDGIRKLLLSTPDR